MTTSLLFLFNKRNKIILHKSLVNFDDEQLHDVDLSIKENIEPRFTIYIYITEISH